jgi:hypothetical protein
MTPPLRSPSELVVTRSEKSSSANSEGDILSIPSCSAWQKGFEQHLILMPINQPDLAPHRTIKSLSENHFCEVCEAREIGEICERQPNSFLLYHRFSESRIIGDEIKSSLERQWRSLFSFAGRSIISRRTICARQT